MGTRSGGNATPVFIDSDGLTEVAAALNPTGASSAQVQGNIAAGVADAGNPVKAGGKYDATKPTLTDGWRGNFQLTARGSLHTTLFDAGANAISTITPNALGQSAAGFALVTGSFSHAYNGSSWDPHKKPVAALTFRLLTSGASTNAAVIAASPRDLFKIVGTNTNAAKRYLKLYNKATTPTVGTDVPVLTFELPINSVNGGRFEFSFDSPVYFGTGIGIALTTAAADADTGAVSAGDIVCLNITIG